jgi:hypothetical protein
MTLTPIEVALIAASGVVVGGLIAGGFALLTGWLQGRREHKRWVRQRRLDAYLVYLRLADQMMYTHAEADQAASVPEMWVRMPQVLEADSDIAFIGPHNVSKRAKELDSAILALQSLVKKAPTAHAERLVWLMAQPEWQAFLTARSVFMHVARKELKLL